MVFHLELRSSTNTMLFTNVEGAIQMSERGRKGPRGPANTALPLVDLTIDNRLGLRIMRVVEAKISSG